MRVLAGFLALTWSCTQASSDVFLNFEGICPPDNSTTPIGAYYGGLGVYFDSGATVAMAIVDSDEGGTAQGNFANEPSSKTVMYFPDRARLIINLPGGFEVGFSTYYTSIDRTATVELYDGVDGTGMLLASAPLHALGTDPNGGDPTGSFNRWDRVDVFLRAGDVARSVKFIAVNDYFGFDDMSFGLVPSPSALTLTALGALLLHHRRRLPKQA